MKQNKIKMTKYWICMNTNLCNRKLGFMRFARSSLSCLNDAYRDQTDLTHQQTCQGAGHMRVHCKRT
jgi:hypothetical protein